MFISLLVLTSTAILMLHGRAEPVQTALPDETMTIRGRVTDRETGQALPRARVSAYSGGGIDPKRPPTMSTTTDDAGFYELAGLSRHNSYLVLAIPPPHVSSHLAQVYGVDGPFDPAAHLLVRAKPLEPIDFGTADIALTRARSIEGRVLSDEGDPVAGMEVVLQRTDQPAWQSAVRLTDDRGAFRHFALLPGRYRVCASASPASVSSTPRSIRRTCYPAASTEPLELGTGNAAGIEIRLARGKAATLAGIARDATGAPTDRMQMQFIENDDPLRKSRPIERLPGGRFVIRGIEHGVYRLFAAAPSGPDDRELRERVTMPVVVDGDIDDLEVRTRPAATISGLVSFEGGPPSEAMTRLGVVARSDDPVFPIQPSRMVMIPAAVKSDLSFRFEGVFQSVRLGVIGLPSGWLVRSITYRGREILDTPVDFEGPIDPNPITIVLAYRDVRVP